MKCFCALAGATQDELPCSQLQSTQVDEGGEFVLVIFLADLHRYGFIYNSLSFLIQHCPVSKGELAALRLASRYASEAVGSKNGAAFRDWLGLIRPWAHGAPPSKHFKANDASSALQLAFGNWDTRVTNCKEFARIFNIRSYTRGQWDILINRVTRNTVIDNVAGAGKTMLLKTFAYMMLNSPARPLVFLTSESTAMVHELYNSVMKFAEPTQVLLLTTEVIGNHWEDHGDAFLQNLTSTFLTDELPLVDVIDKQLVLLHEVLLCARRCDSGRAPMQSVTVHTSR